MRNRLLEEAAKVADAYAEKAWAAPDIAADIRALKSKEKVMQTEAKFDFPCPKCGAVTVMTMSTAGSAIPASVEVVQSEKAGLRFKVMLPENYVVVEAETEEEAKGKALVRFKGGITADDLIAWEEEQPK